ncbi:MAG: hypothetical protein F4230_00325, partial [Holophagales bacterium]|nr:hypothetical protein [Holophagales bacterium]
MEPKGGRLPFPLARRDFLRASLIGFGASLGLPSWGAQPASDRDRFGGWTGLKFGATGFFRTEHDGRRWWLVTPEGHAFISWGVNHYHANWWAQDYNRDHWLRRFGAEEVYDRAWNRGFREAALADLGRLGLNTLGIHTNATMLTHPPGQAR